MAELGYHPTVNTAELVAAARAAGKLEGKREALADIEVAIRTARLDARNEAQQSTEELRKWQLPELKKPKKSKTTLCAGFQMVSTRHPLWSRPPRNTSADLIGDDFQPLGQTSYFISTHFLSATTHHKYGTYVSILEKLA